MDGGLWEPGFSLLEWEFTDKQEEAGIIYVAIEWIISIWTHTGILV